MVAVRGGGFGWLAAGTIPNSLYRVPFFYIILACVFCYCSFLFVVLFCFAVFFFCSRTLELCRCSSNLFLSSRPRTYRIGNHLLYVLEARSVNNVKKQQQMYTYINRHARTPNKTKIRDTMSLDYSSVCNIGSRVVWVSMKKIH